MQTFVLCYRLGLGTLRFSRNRGRRATYETRTIRDLNSPSAGSQPSDLMNPKCATLVQKRDIGRLPQHVRVRSQNKTVCFLPPPLVRDAAALDFRTRQNSMRRVGAHSQSCFPCASVVTKPAALPAPLVNPPRSQTCVHCIMKRRLGRPRVCM